LSAPAPTIEARERPPLPDREQIFAMSDVAALRTLEDDVNRVITKIEADLEFGPGDEQWAGRARGALVAHRVTLGHVRKRIHAIEGRPNWQASQDREAANRATKAQNREAAALASAAAAEKKRLALEEQRLKNEDLARKLEAQRLDLIKRTSWLRHFHRAAKDWLSPDVFDEITWSADERHASALAAEVEKGRAA
jgi:truncated hemoglobin YjbI